MATKTPHTGTLRDLRPGDVIREVDGVKITHRRVVSRPYGPVYPGGPDGVVVEPNPGGTLEWFITSGDLVRFDRPDRVPRRLRETARG
jgi:hypothetical protein